jgi:hypothetical protein
MNGSDSLTRMGPENAGPLGRETATDPGLNVRRSEQIAARKTLGVVGAAALTITAVPLLMFGAAYAGMVAQPSPDRENVFGSALGVAMVLVGFGLLCCASWIFVRHSVVGPAGAIALPLAASAAWLAFTWWMVFSDVMDIFLHVPVIYYFALTGFAIPIAPALAIAYGVMRSRSRRSRIAPWERTDVRISVTE